MADVVAVLGRGVVPADEPLLYADDFGVLRGDGIFETIHVRDGVPFLLSEHVSRMARSADRMRLDLPDAAAMIGLAGQACDAYGPHEGALRLVCTRGRETGGPPTVFATLKPVAPAILAARRDGLRLAPLTLGYGVHTRAAAPWLLGGAKCLSYAIAMAAVRHAGELGFDDVLWTSEDGFVFEGPTSSVVWAEGEVLYTVPAETGVLPGTTNRYLFDRAEEVGFVTAEKIPTVAQLAESDGVWLTSSVRGISPVLAIGENELAMHPLTRTLQRLLGFPTPD
ncbi:aminotransferase class IV [Stackebrandtia soli]|uniref:aminotransferase class IV n=1 Tax=Stackebrandtia soli TaxID=1892856 RepID=UPI0039EC55F1